MVTLFQSLAEEQDALARLGSTPQGRANKMYPKREAKVGQLECDVQFLESLTTAVNDMKI